MINGWINYIATVFSTESILLSANISLERVLGYISVGLLGTIKFWVSILFALGAKYTFLEVLLSGSLGAFIGVCAFTFFGTEIRKWWTKRFPRKKPWSFARRRKVYKLWHTFGLWGVAFLGPFISPPIAVGIAVTFREKPRRIILYMTISIIFWTFIFTIFRDNLLRYLG